MHPDSFAIVTITVAISIAMVGIVDIMAVVNMNCNISRFIDPSIYDRCNHSAIQLTVHLCIYQLIHLLIRRSIVVTSMYLNICICIARSVCLAISFTSIIYTHMHFESEGGGYATPSEASRN